MFAKANQRRPKSLFTFSALILTIVLRPSGAFLKAALQAETRLGENFESGVAVSRPYLAATGRRE